MDTLARGSRVAVVDSGAVGLTAAWYLQRRHEVTLLEGAPRIGGHDELEVASQPGDMSFGYACERSGLQYAGTGLDGLFAQRANLVPSADLLERFDEHMTVVDSWDLDGTHYQRACEAWLERMSANREQVEAALGRGYGPDEVLRRWHRWRVFFLACAELFGHQEGGQRIVAHRLLARRSEHGASADRE